ncbi:MAG: radical SAM protein, partial [Firmicutes bacterium]|nr:radical SAM protein [Bacillota bacterium]
GISGATFSGGEPFLQAKPLALLGERIKRKNLNLLTYTGYTFERLYREREQREDWAALLAVSDFLIDGPFIEERKDLGLPYRGSRNQRFIDLSASLKEGKAIPFKMEGEC